MKITAIGLILATVFSSLYSQQPYAPSKPPPNQNPNIPNPSVPTPWFTGPLISDTGAAFTVGHFSINNYVFVTTNTGTYNKNWDTVSAPRNFTIVNPEWLIYAGLTPWCDFQTTIPLYYQTTSNKRSVQFGDLMCGLDFQLLDIDATPYFPGIKLTVEEIFPTGHYNRLDPTKLGTDGTGAGSFGTLFSLIFYKVYHLTGNMFLNNYFDLIYTVQSPIPIHGASVYGGDPSTRGTALGGNIFQALFSFELALTQNWVFAMDNVYTHTNSVSFSGKTNSAVGRPSSEQFSFAPAIEYNFNAYWGVIVGCWFSGWGRNSTQFRSGAINIEGTY